jgi:hypothetical protein
MASSCKIAEYMAVNLPIVTTRTPNILSNFPEQAEALDKFMPPPNDAPALAKAILLQLNDNLIVSQPTGMTWQEISDRTLEQIQSFEPLKKQER